MKSVLFGLCAAALIAFGAALYLNTEVQESATQAFQTSGVRL
jgi:hypothetical protein